jgi:hypothetical protein
MELVDVAEQMRMNRLTSKSVQRSHLALGERVGGLLRALDLGVVSPSAWRSLELFMIRIRHQSAT